MNLAGEVLPGLLTNHTHVKLQKYSGPVKQSQWKSKPHSERPMKLTVYNFTQARSFHEFPSAQWSFKLYTWELWWNVTQPVFLRNTT